MTNNFHIYSSLYIKEKLDKTSFMFLSRIFAFLEFTFYMYFWSAVSNISLKIDIYLKKILFGGKTEDLRKKQSKIKCVVKTKNTNITFPCFIFFDLMINMLDFSIWVLVLVAFNSFEINDFYMYWRKWTIREKISLVDWPSSRQPLIKWCNKLYVESSTNFIQFSVTF